MKSSTRKKMKNQSHSSKKTKIELVVGYTSDSRDDSFKLLLSTINKKPKKRRIITSDEKTITVKENYYIEQCSFDVNELMRLEKERLGISPDKLVFIGMANFANYYWCAWQYYLKSKRDESVFFAVYFEDRILNASKLGLINKIPKTALEALKIGNSIEYENIEILLKKN